MPEGLETFVLGKIPTEAPTKWEEVATVDKLYIYPCKSTRGILVPEAKATPTGFQSGLFVDRQFMVIDAKHKFITARKYPKMVLIETDVKQEPSSDQLVLTLSAPASEKMGTLEVVLPEWDSESLVRSEVFGEEVSGQDLGDECSRWLSKLLLCDAGAGLRMIWHKPADSTRVEHAQSDLFPRVKKEYKPFFADEMPYLLFSQQSVDGLNQKLKNRDVDLTVEERRFRPNIFVKDVKGPFAEDSWTYIKINDVVFVNSDLCGRCLFTTIDPSKGEKDSRQEPLKTLRSFRATLKPEEKKKVGTKPFFGIHLGVEKAGTIKAGDKVFVGKAV